MVRTRSPVRFRSSAPTFARWVETSYGWRANTAKVVHRSAPAKPASGVWSGRRGSNPRPTAWKAVTLPLSYSRVFPSTLLQPSALSVRLRLPASARQPSLKTGSPSRSSLARPASEGWWGGEGSNLRSPKAAGLQPAAIDRSATSPIQAFSYSLSAVSRIVVAAFES